MFLHLVVSLETDIASTRVANQQAFGDLLTEVEKSHKQLSIHSGKMLSTLRICYCYPKFGLNIFLKFKYCFLFPKKFEVDMLQSLYVGTNDYI